MDIIYFQLKYIKKFQRKGLGLFNEISRLLLTENFENENSDFESKLLTAIFWFGESKSIRILNLHNNEEKENMTKIYNLKLSEYQKIIIFNNFFRICICI